MSSKNIIISIHYHKTGSQLSSQLYNIFGKYINDYIYVRNWKNKRIFTWDSKNCIRIQKIKFSKERYQIYSKSAPNFFRDIFSEMPQISKIIHLVRCSYDWCLSNYLYHIQYPTPEKWFESVNININSWFNKDELLFMSDELNLDFAYIQKLINYIKSVYNCPPGKNYYQYLRSIPPEKGIIIETTRFLLNNNYHGGCDHLRMAINSKYLNYHSKNILTLHMNDFRENNIKPTLEKLFSFIIGYKISKKHLKSIVSDYKQTPKKKNHVTYNKVSEDHKNKLLNSLKENKEISFILDYIDLLTPKSYFMSDYNIK